VTGALPVPQSTQSSLMAREAAEAPDVVARLVERNAGACRALGARLRSEPPRFVVTCARGSSDSAATYAKYLIELSLGTVVASVGPSISSVYRVKLRMRDALFLAISQSGRSPDLLALARAARADGALTVAIVNDAASPLAVACEIVLPLHAGPEASIAATKTYLASLAAVLQMVAEWSDNAALRDAVSRLPRALHAALATDWRQAAGLLASARDLYVIGRGVGYAAAQEVALKFKETCGLHAEAISAAELMHGPLALAGTDFPVLILGQDDEALVSLKAMAAELVAQGATVIAAGPGVGWAGSPLPVVGGLHPFVQPIADVQSFYALAEAISRARGYDPDRPSHLRKVTETV
jgi:glucosamine--fructose-6-phosphate aminotransferase (isomerizing)